MRVTLAFALFCAALTSSLWAPAAEAQTFRRPVSCSGCIANWYYFDQDSEDGPTEDWNCNASTYNGHRGSDFSLAGSNDAIPTGYDVVAAAAGVVVSTQDGHYDRCRTCNASVDARCGTGFGFGYGNHVVVNHGSYRVIYAHMRTGSVRVGPGDTVSCGQTIGQIGSSGCTTGAHLHFETRPLGGASTSAFDPFSGGCSPTSPSRWTSQGPHRGMPSADCDGAPVTTCPGGTYEIWTCNAARTNRRRCIGGVDSTEECPYGCLSMPVGTNDVCERAPDADGDGSPANEDCDDGNAARYPGAMETCGDGVDQDCDGSDLPCPTGDAGPGVDSGPIADSGVSDASADSPSVDGAVRLDGNVASDSSVSADAPGVDGSVDVELTGGCSCRTSARSGATDGFPLLLLALVGLRRKRRR